MNKGVIILLVFAAGALGFWRGIDYGAKRAGETRGIVSAIAEPITTDAPRTPGEKVVATTLSAEPPASRATRDDLMKQVRSDNPISRMAE